jgi:hypothetical protein
MILILLFKFYHLLYNHLSSVSCLSTLTHACYITDINRNCHGLLIFHRSFIWSVGMVLCPSLAKCDDLGCSLSSTMSPIHTVDLLLLERVGFQKRTQCVKGFRVVKSSWAASKHQILPAVGNIGSGNGCRCFSMWQALTQSKIFEWDHNFRNSHELEGDVHNDWTVN